MRQKTQNVLGTSLVVRTPVAKTHTPKAGGLGSILGQGTRSHITQLRVYMLHLKKSHMPHQRWKIPRGATKTRQINN